ncbi:YxeA family protein [Paenibacillus popilliae]|uniref:YxeA family protein n=1 Tax=Paenibacillus popilliae TaxID=78057 RepID=A0ABY3ATN9_PAEPP|nr:YxeA family protein [Paenibacillus sp. SDF0028]TQR46197.1 YxeA family protein [Paenibacillus sp. SDF0028]
MKKFISFVVIVIILLAGIFTMFKEDLDRFNPLYSKEEVYVQVGNQQPVPVMNNHRFQYELKGYNAEGKKKTVVFTTSEKLKNGTYLKVLAKGSYTEKWQEVKADQLPKSIKWE